MSNCCFLDSSSVCSAIQAFCLRLPDTPVRRGRNPYRHGDFPVRLVCGILQIKYNRGAKAPGSARPSGRPDLKSPARSAHENFLFWDRIPQLVLKIHLPFSFLPCSHLLYAFLYHNRFFQNRQGLFYWIFFLSVLYSCPCIYAIGFSRLFAGVRTGS